MFEEHGDEISDGLQRSMKSNLLPVILTGIGIAWMMLGQRDDGYGSRGGSGRRYPAHRQPQYGSQHIDDAAKTAKAKIDEAKSEVSTET